MACIAMTPRTETVRHEQSSTTKVAKIVEIIGTSDESWEAAAQVAIEEARKTIRGIRGIKIKEMSARIDSNSGKISEYRTCVNLSFGILDEER